MSGPSPYAADIWSAFAPGAQLAGVGPPSAAPVVSGTPMPGLAPPPSATGYPSLLDIPTSPSPPPILPPAGPPPPPPDPGMSFPSDNPGALASIPPPLSSQGPPPPGMGVQAGPPPPPPHEPQDPTAFPLVSAGVSGSPAHEVDRRGPTLANAQGVLNEGTQQAIGDIAGRNQDDAALEYGMALDQERSARDREAALQQSFAEREEDMFERQQDFDLTVRQMGKMGHIDQNRFFASRTTGGKVAGVIEMMLAGFRGAPSMAMQIIDRDIKAQEFAYMATRDVANAKHTAFQSAMSKWQNVDAARATARAASIDVLQARLAQVAAVHRGTEVANRAEMAMNDLQREKVAQIQQGIQFVPPQSRGRMWIDPRTGLTYNENEAKAMMAKREEWGQDDRKLAAGVGGQLVVEGVKADAEARKEQAKSGGNTVQLPNGQIVVAPTPDEAKTLRGLSVAVENANQLVAQAKEIRSQSGWWASPQAGRELDRIGAELTLAFKDRGGLGALSGPDMELAMRGTGDLKSVMPGVDHALDGFQQTTGRALQNRVKTLPGAPDNAKGSLSPEAKRSLGGYSK